MSNTRKALILGGMAVLTLVGVASVLLFALHVTNGFLLQSRGLPNAQVGPPPPEWEAPVDRVLEKLQLGNIAFNTPTHLQLGVPTEIHLILSTQRPIEDLQEMIAEAGGKEGARIRISSQMQAHLAGSGFRIEPITPEAQRISGTEVTEWKWEVKPTEEGNQTLYLTLSALLSVEGERIPRAVRTFERTIDVNVTWPMRLSGFATNNWQWLWTTFLVPLWIWTISMVRRPKAQPKGIA